MDVSDRRMQVQLTQEAKIASDFFFIGAIFAVAGFVSALAGAAPLRGRARFMPAGAQAFFAPRRLPRGGAFRGYPASTRSVLPVSRS